MMMIWIQPLTTSSLSSHLLIPSPLLTSLYMHACMCMMIILSSYHPLGRSSVCNMVLDYRTVSTIHAKITYEVSVSECECECEDR